VQACMLVTMCRNIPIYVLNGLWCTRKLMVTYLRLLSCAELGQPALQRSK
jgi:hypothetical protein